MKRNFIILTIIVVAILLTVSCSSKSDDMIGEAKTALDNGEYKTAISICDKAIESDKDNAEFYGIRGCAYYETSEYDKAIDDCQRAVSLGVKDVYDPLWKSYLKKNNEAKAVDVMESCIKDGEASDDTYAEVINQYEKNGEYKKARDMKRAAYRAVGGEQFTSIAVSDETASDKGGFFVMADDTFYPLQECGDPSKVFYNEVNLEHMVFTYNYTESIPALCDGDKLVLFTEDGLDEAYCSVAKVQKQGYTIPVYFSDPADGGSGAYGKHFIFPVFDSESEEIDETFRTDNVESINGMDYAEFSKKYIFSSRDVCSEKNDSVLVGQGCTRMDQEFVADLKKEESVEFKYHSGSSQEIDIIDADIGYYCFDMHHAPEKSVNLTDQSYAVVDTGSLENGTYILQLEGRSGFSMRNPYIFKVTK